MLFHVGEGALHQLFRKKKKEKENLIFLILFCTSKGNSRTGNLQGNNERGWGLRWAAPGWRGPPAAGAGPHTPTPTLSDTIRASARAPTLLLVEKEWLHKSPAAGIPLLASRCLQPTLDAGFVFSFAISCNLAFSEEHPNSRASMTCWDGP